jgi:hypothetical protein
MSELFCEVIATRRAAEAVALLDPGSPSPDAVTRFIIFAFFLLQRKFESRRTKVGKKT